MSAANNALDEHERRVAAITDIAVESNALVLDSATHELAATDDPNAEKTVYAKAFQAWADGRIDGTAEDVFETVQEVLEV